MPGLLRGAHVLGVSPNALRIALSRLTSSGDVLLEGRGLYALSESRMRAVAHVRTFRLAGLTFVRRIVGLVLMDAGVLTYSASLGQRRVVPRPALPAMLKNLARNTGPVLITNGALYAALVPFRASERQLCSAATGVALALVGAGERRAYCADEPERRPARVHSAV